MLGEVSTTTQAGGMKASPALCSQRGHWQKSSSPRRFPLPGQPGGEPPALAPSAPGGTPSSTHSAPPDSCLPDPRAGRFLGPAPPGEPAGSQARRVCASPRAMPRAMLTAWCPTASWAESSAEPGLNQLSAQLPTGQPRPCPLHPQLLVQETPGAAGDEGVQALQVGLPTRLCL